MCLSTICIPKVAWYTYFLRLTRSFGAPKSIGDGCSSPFLQVAALQGLMSNECSVEHHMAGYIVLEGYRRSVPIPIPAPLPLGCCKGPGSDHNYLSVWSFMWQLARRVRLAGGPQTEQYFSLTAISRNSILAYFSVLPNRVVMRWNFHQKLTDSHRWSSCIDHP